MTTAVERRSEPALPEPDAEPSRDRLWWLALAAAMVVAGGLILYVGRGTGFWFDEWDWIFLRRGWSADALLAPHNQHLSLLPVLVFKLGFSTVGLGSYVPYRLVGLALHLTCGALLFAYARPRVGGALALAAACVLLFLGPAWQDILWAFQIGYLGSLAAGLGALLALDRRSRGGDVLAAALLTVALASSSLGIPILGAAVLEIAFSPQRLRRWPVIAVPVLLYALWYAGYGVSEGVTADNILETPSYMAEAAAGATGAMFGLGVDWGRPLALGVAAFVVWRALTLRTRPWRLAVLVALPLAFWAVTGFARAQFNEPAAPRYLYPGVVFLLLVLAEAGAGLGVSRRALLLVALLLVPITVSNVGALRNGGGWLRDRHDGIVGGLAATDLAGGAEPGFQPALADSPQITIGNLQPLREELPAAPRDLARASAFARKSADATLVRLDEIGLAPGGAATGVPAVQPPPALITAPANGCLRATGAGDLEVPVAAGGLTVTAKAGTVTVAVRRFADAFSDPLGTIAQGATQTLKARADSSPVPWRARLSIAGEARVCGG